MPLLDRNASMLFQCALVVEPVQNLRKLVTGLMSPAGVERVISCTNPVEAVSLIDLHHCDLAFCSSSSGAADAFALAVRRAIDSPNRALPIVQLAKQAKPETITAARDNGIDTVLAVPFSGAALASRVRALAVTRPALIEVDSYVGPDRRRTNRPILHAERRAGTSAPAAYQKRYQAIIRDFIRARAHGTPEGEASKSEVSCTIAALKPAQKLLHPVKTRTGLLVVEANQDLTEKTLYRMKDLIRAGELEDQFFVADDPV